MSDQHDVPTLTENEIQTRRVDGGKPTWEAPRLTELEIAGSQSGAVVFSNERTGSDAVDDTGGPAS